MARHWIRGLCAVLMTGVIVGGIVYLGQYAIDRQAEISSQSIKLERFNVEESYKMNLEIWKMRYKAQTPCTAIRILPTPVPDPNFKKQAEPGLIEPKESSSESDVEFLLPKKWKPRQQPRRLSLPRGVVAVL